VIKKAPSFANATLMRTATAAAAAAVVMIASGCLGSDPKTSVQDAITLASKGDHAEATVTLKAVLSQGTDTAQVRWLLGRSLLASHEAGAASAELKKALDLGHPADEVIPVLARAYLEAGRPEMVARDMSRLAPLGNPQARAALQAALAEAWGALSDMGKMEHHLRAALALDPQQPQALRTQTRLLASRGDIPGAKAILTEALRQHPEDTSLLALRGDFEVIEGAPDAAAKTFGAALAKDKLYVSAHVRLISLHLAAKKLADATKQLEAMREALPRHALTVYMEAQIAFESGEVAKARDLCRALLRASPENAQVLHLAGVAEASLGSLVTAQSHLTKALQLEPDDQSLRHNLASVYLRLGQPRIALTVLKPVLDTDRAESQVLATAGQASLQLGEVEAAERYFALALQRQPNDLKLRLLNAVATLQRPASADRGLAQLRDLTQQDPSVESDKALAGAYLVRRQWVEATASINQALKKSPNDASLHELLGRILAAKGDRQAARSSLEKAIQLDGSNLSSSMALAQLDLIEGRAKDAVERMRKTVAANPRNHFAAIALADLVARNAGTVEERRIILADTIKVNPTEPEPRIALVELLLESRRNREALSAAEDANSAIQGQPGLLDALGRAQRASGSFEQAVTTFKRAATVAPKSPVPHSRLADLYATVGDTKSTELHLRKAVELAPDHGALQSKLVQFLVSAKRQKDALTFARDLQKRLPRLANGHVLEGSLLEAAGDVPGAVKAYRAGLDREPARADVALTLHKGLSRMGRLDEADRFAAEWLRRFPSDAGFSYQVATTDLIRGKFSEAEKRLTELVARHPNNVPTLNNLAWLLMHNKKPGALEFAKRASELAPKNAPVLDTFASALAEAGQVKEALATQRRAAELEPSNHNIKLNLAKLALKAGETALARDQLTELAQLGNAYPYQSEVAKLLASASK
jgi:putative PEP-CTERM system TPR-repeat lipoprotein